MKGRGKGSDFERQICRSLSTWFSEGKADDWFWRADSSGALATFRSRKGKSVKNCGDIKAVDEEGLPLTRLFTIECKRGYSSETLLDLLDILADNPPTWRKFLAQVMEGQQATKTPGWMIISQRNRRKPLVFINLETALRLNDNGATLYRARPQMKFTTTDRIRIFGTTLKEFFDHVPPGAVIDSL